MVFKEGSKIKKNFSGDDIEIVFGNNDFDGIIMKPMITDDNGISADLLNAFKCGREKVTSFFVINYNL